jgi:type I restriction enzyme, S subunit
MDAQQFLAEFRHIISAPEGVQRVRELILQLAICGRLTQRVMNDTPATVLLAENQAAQMDLLSKKEMKRQYAPAVVAMNDSPWTLPEGWLWCRLGQVTNYGEAPKVEYTDVDTDTWVLELEDIEKSTSTLLRRVRAKDRKFQSTKNRFKKGAILYGKLRPYLDKVIIADESGVCTTEICPITFFVGIEAPYLRWYLKSPFFVSYASNATHGMNLPRLGTDAAREALFAFPPKQEQTSIINKVDELMALCDKLEAQREDRKKLHSLTRTSVLDALVDNDNSRELKGAWHRVKGNTSFLFKEPADTDYLRTVILKLASLGRLEDYRDGDSEAAELLDGIIKVQRIEFRNRERKELQALPGPVAIDRHHIQLSLGRIAKIISGQHLAPGEYNMSGDGIPYITGPAEFGVHFPEPTKWTNEKRAVAKKEDILLTVKGSGIGKTSICNADELAISRQLMAVRALGELNTEYLAICLDAAKSTFQNQKTGIAIPGIGREDVLTLELILPSREEQKRIIGKTKTLLDMCEKLALRLTSAQRVASSLAVAAVAAITGIRTEEEEKLKVPITQLVSKLRIGDIPTTKEQAPLASILVHHNNEMEARDLWQRYGGEIDAFYQQLKIEVEKGWIVEPNLAEMREAEAG